MNRAHYLRGFAGSTVYDRPQDTVPTVYPNERVDETNWWSTRAEDAPRDCSVCRDSEIHCTTPDSCMLAEAEQIVESTRPRLPIWLMVVVILIACAGSALVPWGFHQ